MRPRPLGNPREHYWKVTDMAVAVGVSLTDAWEAGRLTPDDHARMIERCRGCTQPGACARLLQDRPVLVSAPDYCRNRATFDDMAKVEGA